MFTRQKVGGWALGWDTTVVHVVAMDVTHCLWEHNSIPSSAAQCAYIMNTLLCIEHSLLEKASPRYELAGDA